MTIIPNQFTMILQIARQAIERVVAEAIGRRLEALGVNEKTPVAILNRKGSGSVIIKVRGTRLALGRKIAEGIEVGRQEDE